MNIKYKGQSISGGGGGAKIPAGIIAMWGGSADDIPQGWALCDGQDGRPDLRDRFVLGAGNSYAVGAMGGEETHKLTTSEMPSHVHSAYGYTSSGTLDKVSKIASTIITGYSRAGATTSSTGGNAAHNNMPPYYALCYIIKL